MKKLITLVTCLLILSGTYAVNRTWTGSVDNVFNKVGNWTGGGSLSPTDNFTISLTSSATIVLNADITVNNLTMSLAGGGGWSARLDAVSHLMTINGTATFDAEDYSGFWGSDYIYLDAGAVGGGFVFNGTANFQTGGSTNGDLIFKADIVNPGKLDFRGTVNYDEWTYTTPADEPDIYYDASGSQTINQTTVYSYVMGESVYYGSNNSPTITIQGSGDWRLHTYELLTWIDTNVTLNMGTAALDCYLNVASVFQMNPGSTLKIGGTRSFPGDNTLFGYLLYSLDETSTVIYEGTNQTIKGTNVTYGNLTLDGAGTKTSGSSFTVKGDFINNSTFANGNDQHTFDGGVDQVIGGTSVTSFYQLTMDKSGTNLILQNDIDVEHTLALTDGDLKLNGNELTITRDATGSLTRTSGVIVSESTDMSGILTRRVNSVSGGHLFPFARVDGSYIPFTYERASANNGYVSVATYTTAADNTPLAPGVSNLIGAGLADNSSSTVDRFWQIDVTGTVSANFTFTYADDEAPADGEDDLKAQRWDSGLGGWRPPTENIASQTASAVANTVTANGVVAASPWTVSRSSSQLPIELISFEAVPGDDDVNLNWLTATEINNDYFTLERSADGFEFYEIGTVDGAGNSQITLVYGFSDLDPLPGISYYRLKQTDYDGAFTYSEKKRVNFNPEATDVLVYPQPASGGYLNIELSSDSESSSNIKLLDVQGRLILRTDFYGRKGQVLRLETGDIPGGTYLLMITSDNQMISKKIMIE